MLQWLAGNKIDHPMADARRAREIVDELPADSVKALEEVAEWLDSLARTEAFGASQRFELIALLDAAAKPHQRKLSHDYLATSRMQKFHENRLWTALFQFWQLLGDGYVQCVAAYGSEAGTSAARKGLPAAVARAMRALALQLKWTLLRYGRVESRIWAGLARLYAAAEKRGFLANEIAIYPGPHGSGSVQQEFLKALMLAVSSTDGLTPARQEIAERLIAHFSPAFRLRPNLVQGANYFFDLAHERAPARLRRRDAILPTVRFFGAGEACSGLQRALGTIIETGALPSEIPLGGEYDKEAVIGVMRHLALYWSDTPPARGADRRRTVARLTVVPGLGSLLATLAPDDGDDLDFSAQPSVESWIADNVSDGGCGALVPVRKSDWARVGCLIGLRAETERHWGLGVIRRVTRDERQNRRVGIQVLTRTAIPVKLAASDARGAAIGPVEPAILLSTSPDSSGEVGVVTRAGFYNSRDSLEMIVAGKTYLLMPSKLAEGGEDYDWARFKVMQKTDDSHA